MATKKYDGPPYAYTSAGGARPRRSRGGEQGDNEQYASENVRVADDTVDVENLKKGNAELNVSEVPDMKAMRYIQNDSLSGFLNPKAGAGRGGQGGPTAKELADYEKKQNAGIFTVDKGNPPQDIDSASAHVKKASGGKVSSASSRADGIAQRGKTRGKMC